MILETEKSTLEEDFNAPWHVRNNYSAYRAIMGSVDSVLGSTCIHGQSDESQLKSGKFSCTYCTRTSLFICEILINL